MSITELPSKIKRISFLIFTIQLSSVTFYGQTKISELPAGEFAPEPEEIEDYSIGIAIYDQYSLVEKSPKIRKDASGNIVNGKVEDFYANGFILHKGTYSNGVLKTYDNYYVNGSKERKFKGKKEGEGELESYYLNGYIRSLHEYYNYKVVGSEVYYNNGVLKRKEELDKETLVPNLIVVKNNENTVMSKVVLIDKDSLIYEKEVYKVNGYRMAYGRMILDQKTGEIINDGPYYTFDSEGNFTSEVIYSDGNVKEIKLEERSEAEREYFSYVQSEAVLTEVPDEIGSEKTSVEKSTIIPSDYIRFDKDNDDFISNREVDNAVSEFFEDDSITLEQINGLVNYFFEQD